MDELVPTTMSAAERTELGKLLRLRGKVAKQDIDQRAVRLEADFEAQLASRYKASNAAWAHVTKQAEEVVKAADEQVAAICREKGVPEEFRPGLSLYWYGRGENADKDRRAELRRVLKTELEARVKNGKLEVDRAVADGLTKLAAGALTSSEAKAFLATMPTSEQLLPAVTLPEATSLPMRLELVKAITGKAS